MIPVNASEAQIKSANISQATEINTPESLQQLAEDTDMVVKTFRKEKLNPKMMSYSNNSSQSIQTGEIETISYFTPKNIIHPYSNTGSKYEETDIVFYSACIYSTIYYNKKVEDNINYIQLTKVSGGIKDLLNFSLDKQEITYGSFGATDGNPISELVHTKKTTNKTWSYSGDFPYVNSQATHTIECSIKATIYHRTSYYTGESLNHY